MRKEKSFAKFSLIFVGLVCLAVFFFAVFVFLERKDFFDRFIYELKRPFTWDTTMYYAVGKGMVHGLKPYVDMFETKPPMIFFTAAVSYALTGDYYLCNVLSFLCLAFVTLAPSGGVLMKLAKSGEKNPIKWVLYLLSALFIGMLLGGYAQLRSGEVQVELLGSAFILGYLLLAKSVDYKKSKIWSPKIIFSSLLLMIGVMYKEPFILIAFAGALVICKNLKDWFYRFVLPCIYGGVLGVILLAVTGTLIPYISVYLPHMLGNHINIYGSPFERMLNLNKISNDITKYSKFALPLIKIAFLVTAVKVLTEKSEYNRLIARLFNIVIKLVRIFIAPYILSFVIGLGGQYYNHHYIFALPCYVLYIVSLLEFIYSPAKGLEWFTEFIKESKIVESCGKVIAVILSVISLWGIYRLPLPNYSHYNKILSYAKTMQDDARYLDDVLDALGLETYQYFGFNGPIVYAYTTHDPLGPVFFQDPNNLQREDNFFATNLKEQMERVDIFVVSYIKCGVLTDYVNDYIADNFTLIVNSGKYELIKDIEKPQSFTYKIFVRKEV